MVVYADILLVINFAVDYILLKGAALLCGKQTKNLRLTASAALGALCSLIIFFDISGNGMFYRTAAAIALSAAAFCPCEIKTFFKCLAAVLIQSFMLSGIILLWQISAGPVGVMSRAGAIYLDIGIPALIICAAAGYAMACLLSRIILNKFPNEQFCDVTLINNCSSVSFTALIDTGNSLIEPFSGLPVIVCELWALGGTVPEEIKEFDIEHPATKKIRLIPYKTMDSSGLLPAFVPERVLISYSGESRHEIEKCYIAVTTARLGDDYRAICNPAAINNIKKVGDAVYEKNG